MFKLVVANMISTSSVNFQVPPALCPWWLTWVEKYYEFNYSTLMKHLTADQKGPRAFRFSHSKALTWLGVPHGRSARGGNMFPKHQSECRARRSYTSPGWLGISDDWSHGGYCMTHIQSCDCTEGLFWGFFLLQCTDPCVFQVWSLPRGHQLWITTAHY